MKNNPEGVGSNSPGLRANPCPTWVSANGALPRVVAVQRSPHRRRVAVQRHHHCPNGGGSTLSPLPDRWRFNVITIARMVAVQR